MIRLADAQQATLERLHEDNMQLARMVDQNSQAMAEILKYVIDTTSRTERMTGEILTRLAAGQGH
jgi:hypothetical protein